jgi:hypothetical protein
VDSDKLSAPERALWQAFPRGELVDLTKARGVRARSIRGEVISSLLLGNDPGAHQGHVPAIRIEGARITGPLDLANAVIPGPVVLRHCEIQALVDMTAVRARGINLEGSQLTGLLAPLAHIDGDLRLVGCTCLGQVVLTGARISGALQMQRAHLDHPGQVALLGNRLVVNDDLLAQGAVVDGEFRLAGAQVGGMAGLDGATFRHEGGRALNAFNLTVGAGLLARSGFSAAGEVALSGAKIEREVDFRGSTLANPGGVALLAIGLQAGTYIALSEGFSARGAIRLSRAKIGSEVYLSGGRFSNPGGDAIRCRYTEATTFVLDADSTVEGTVDLRFSRFTDIRDHPSCWPATLKLSGLGYDTLDPPLPAADRIRWLSRDIDGYLPRNYETLAAMYRALGDDASARAIQLAKERARRAQLAWYGRAWSWLQETTVGYGYRPLRATAWLGAFLALGTLTFGIHHPPPLQGSAHTAFNPFIYTLDLLVPLVGLGMRNSYDPQGPQRWLAYLLIAIGWIFVTTIAAGVLRVLRRQ